MLERATGDHLLDPEAAVYSFVKLNHCHQTLAAAERTLRSVRIVEHSE